MWLDGKTEHSKAPLSPLRDRTNRSADGQPRHYDCAATLARSADLKRPAELPDPFLHPPNADSRFAPRHDLRALPCGNARSPILHFDANVVLVPRNTNPAYRASRVAMNVGKAFLYHTENRRLQFPGQSPKVPRDLHVHFDFAPLRKPIHITAKGR